VQRNPAPDTATSTVVTARVASAKTKIQKERQKKASAFLELISQKL
jgi:hypothetical protein